MSSNEKTNADQHAHTIRCQMKSWQTCTYTLASNKHLGDDEVIYIWVYWLRSQVRILDHRSYSSLKDKWGYQIYIKHLMLSHAMRCFDSSLRVKLPLDVTSSHRRDKLTLGFCRWRLHVDEVVVDAQGWWRSPRVGSILVVSLLFSPTWVSPNTQETNTRISMDMECKAYKMMSMDSLITLSLAYLLGKCDSLNYCIMLMLIAISSCQ